MAAATSIEALFKLVRDAQTVDLSGVAATACLVYDIFITMDQEVEYIWKSRWTIPKYLYLWARYFALFIQIVVTAEQTSRKVTNKFCAGWTYFEGITGQLLVMGVELLLILRVWALYKRNRQMLYILVALYIAEVTANTVILGMALPRFTSLAPLHSIFPPEFPLSGCLEVQVVRFFYSYWIPDLLFESSLFILMLINFVRLARDHTPMPLIKRFFRDGTVYYAVIFATLLAQVLLYELVSSALAQVAIGWQLTMFSIMGSRLVLSLRAASEEPADSEMVELADLSKHSHVKPAANSSEVNFIAGSRGHFRTGTTRVWNGGHVEGVTPLGTDGWISEWERI